MRDPAGGAWRIGTLASLVLLAACSAIRFGPGDPGVDLTGVYVGSVLVDGQRIPSRLELAQRGEDVEAVFRADELGLTTRGGGDVDRDGTFALDLDYDVECPGSARFQGRWLEDGLRLAGTVSAIDCTGSFSGDFSFRRR